MRIANPKDMEVLQFSFGGVLEAAKLGMKRRRKPASGFSGSSRVFLREVATVLRNKRMAAKVSKTSGQQ